MPAEQGSLPGLPLLLLSRRQQRAQSSSRPPSSRPCSTHSLSPSPGSGQSACSHLSTQHQHRITNGKQVDAVAGGWEGSLHPHSSSKGVRSSVPGSRGQASRTPEGGNSRKCLLGWAGRETLATTQRLTSQRAASGTGASTSTSSRCSEIRLRNPKSWRWRGEGQCCPSPRVPPGPPQPPRKKPPHARHCPTCRTP